MRGLVPLLDNGKRKIVYSDFQDEVIAIRDTEVVPMRRMTGAQYEKKVKSFLATHLDHPAVQRLRRNQPLTPTDLESLEATLKEIGEEDGETLLQGLLARSEAPSPTHFVRRLVGLDRAAAQAVFSDFLNDRSLTPPQIRFVEEFGSQL